MLRLADRGIYNFQYYITDFKHSSRSFVIQTFLFQTVVGVVSERTIEFGTFSHTWNIFLFAAAEEIFS